MSGAHAAPSLEVNMPVTLPWFPPAPAPGPASILSLPPDDWVMQPKIDGIRVIIYRGYPFTRLGQPLSNIKGAVCLRAMFAGFEETLDGEWVSKEGKYYAFDLPDQPGDLDERSNALRKIACLKIPGIIILDSYGGHFARIYASLPRETTEGVVFKRRSSLYAKQRRASSESRDWLKRQFVWD
jgi:ATP-dependent DNA ligase